MTDIHDLDQYIGKYISLTDPDGEGAAGFLVKVHDEVDYIPHPVRSVMLDWGVGWRISEETDVNPYPSAPDGQKAPQVVSGIDVLHEFAHDGGCPDMNCRVRARRQLRALRIWRMQQDDAYWKYRYIRAARQVGSDPDAISYLIEEAIQEGAPEEVVDGIRIIRERAEKAARGDR